MRSPFLRTTALILIPALLALGGCSRQTAEEKGAAMATEKIDIAKGIGDAMTAKGEAAGEAAFTGIGKVFHGVRKGVAKSGWTIAPHASVGSAGLSVSSVRNAEEDVVKKTPHGLNAYVIATTPAHGRMQVLVYNVLGKEIGRAAVTVQRDTDAAGYVFFPLDSLVVKDEITKLVFKFEPAKTSAEG